MTGQRWIMHIDMDAFYASIEQLDHPAWRGRPLVVGEGPRSVVAAASYEARVFGIHSAMPVAQARRLCPACLFVPVRMPRYKEVSRQIMAILRQFSPTVEQASVDEAYLDATGLERLFGPPEALAAQVRAAIFNATRLTCSIGLAPVKFLAKIASDLNKPNGVAIIGPEAMPAFLRQLPVKKIPGVGRKTLLILERFGVHTGEDVLRYPGDFWERRLGKAGVSLWRKAQGLDQAAVTPDAPPKSESAERTLAEDTLDQDILRAMLMEHAERVCARLRALSLRGHTVTLKVKFCDFSQVTRSRTIRPPTNSTRRAYELGAALLAALPLPKKVRLIGLGLSGFEEPARQLSMFAEDDPASGTFAPAPTGAAPACTSGPDQRDAALNAAIDRIRAKFGHDALLRGQVFTARRQEPDPPPPDALKT